MSHELLAELSEEELKPPEYYPIEYALMWVAYGNKPINLDYAKIIYVDPPSCIVGKVLKNAERKLLMYLRSGKISAKTMDYALDEKGKYVATGKYETLDHRTWKGHFGWDDCILAYSDMDVIMNALILN